MKKSIKRYLAIICICAGILLIIGSVAMIIADRYEKKKNREYSAEILSRIHSSMPESGDSAEDLNIFSAASLSIDGVDYTGILSIPSLDIEFPITAAYDVSSVAVYRLSEQDAPLVLSCNDRSWSAVADASVGDRMAVTDMRGCTREYTVAEITRVSSYEAPSGVSSDDGSLTLVTVSNGAYVLLRCEIY